MFLILSGSYVEQELRAEFGRLPPSFLPLGNKRLLEHQLKLIQKGKFIYLTIPDDFVIDSMDQALIDEYSVTVLETPKDLSLGQAFVASLNLINRPLDQSLQVLFGDTLFNKLPKGRDVVAVSSTLDNYEWSQMRESGVSLADEDSKDSLICGYFCFSQPRQLIRCLTQQKWDFLSGLDRYQAEIGLASIKVDDWYDFGHVNTYYHSKASFTTERAFNELTITRHFIEKSSVKDRKIRAEANWFKSIPAPLRSYTPQYLGDKLTANGVFSYSLEYLYNTALNELYVFSKIPANTWSKILSHCLAFIQACEKVERPKDAPSADLNELFGLKTQSRVEEFCNKAGISQDDTWQYNENSNIAIKDILATSYQYLPDTIESSSLMHGDFCFSNILYDFRTDRIKTIDPRGLNTGDEITVFGDVRYDLAKLSHSILGLYDFIIAGFHDTSIDFERRLIKQDICISGYHKAIQRCFIDIVDKAYGLMPKTLYAMQLQLFLSMLPLHADDQNRQNGLFANAFRLYELIGRDE